MAPSGWLKGTVKSVLSGDTLLIMGMSRGGAPPEKQITLASLKAPRLGRRDGGSKDEPFAWESKEFLRKKAIGQSCVFRVEYSVDAMNRQFGTVFLGTENLALSVVENGWAKVNRQGTEKSEHFADLERAENIAQTKELGVWCKDSALIEASIRNLPNDSYTASDLFDKLGKGGVVNGIIDQALNGSLLRVTILPEFYSVLISVAGVQAPSMNKKSPDGELRTEAYAPQSKHFTECRVLNREVRLVLQGKDKYDNVFARILWDHDGNEIDLGKELLKAALARTAEWTLAMMAGKTHEMHALEREAKESKKNIWTNYVPQPSNSDKLTEQFKGIVVEVTSGDCLVVLDSQADVERRVQLSSVRAPRMGSRDRAPDVWAIEAKEFLRRLVVGQTVDVQMEYDRKIPGATGPFGTGLVLMFGNVTMKSEKGDEVNVAEAVLESGHASTVKHRTDEERSCIYDRLLTAEEQAKTSKLAIHSGKTPPPHRLNDVASQPKKARDHLSFLERNGRMRGVVEFVMSGHRLKILLPKDRLLIAFALAGIKSPARAQPAREGQKELKGEPCGEEALRFTRRHLLQREVNIQVEGIDKGGTFLGTLSSAGPHPFDLGLVLLEKGLASLHFTFDESRQGGRLLMAAEEKAREAKIGIWENYTPQTEELDEENGAAAKAREKGGPLKVAVTHIVDGSRFYIQKVNAAQAASISERLAALSLSDQQPAAVPPSKGTFCAAKFTLDDQWYRGYVTSKKPGSCEVYFIDFGNSETLPPERVLPLDPNLASIPPQAIPCRLAYVKVPSLDKDYGYDAASMLDSIVGEGRECEAVSVSQERPTAPWGSGKDPKGANPTLNVILTPVGDSKSVNASLLEAGLARLPNLDNVRNSRIRDGIKNFEKHQEIARKHHKGLFVHGDPGDSEDDEPLPAGPAKK